MNMRPDVAQDLARSRGHSAIDGRATPHPGHAVSQRTGKRIEEGFGWMKAVAGSTGRSWVAPTGSDEPSLPPPTISCACASSSARRLDDRPRPRTDRPSAHHRGTCRDATISTFSRRRRSLSTAMATARSLPARSSPHSASNTPAPPSSSAGGAGRHHRGHRRRLRPAPKRQHYPDRVCLTTTVTMQSSKPSANRLLQQSANAGLTSSRYSVNRHASFDAMCRRLLSCCSFQCS